MDESRVPLWIKKSGCGFARINVDVEALLRYVGSHSGTFLPGRESRVPCIHPESSRTGKSALEEFLVGSQHR